MKSKPVLVIFTLLAVFVNRGWAPPPNTAFTYQGRLSEAGAPAQGSYDLRLAVFDADTQGNTVGLRVDVPAVPVSNGLFTVQFDPGEGVFDGTPRWLQISVRTNGGSYQTLTPRQFITPSPYSQHAVTAASAGSLQSALPASQITGTLSDSLLSPNIARRNTGQVFTGNNTFLGSIGIGGQPVDAILDIEGDAHLNNFDLFFREGSDRNHGLGWYGAGKLFGGVNVDGPVLYGWSGGGLGTMNPSNKLALGWTTGGNVAIDPQGLNSDGLIPGLTFGFNSGEGISSKRAYGDGQYGLDFYTFYQKRMTIANNGNVGIGTNQPQTALHVLGTVTANALDTSGRVTAGALSVVDVSDLHATNDMSIGVTNDLKIKAGTSLDMATKDVVISASGKITIKASSDLILKGSVISLSDNVKAYGFTMNDHDIDWRHDGYNGAGWYGAGKPFGGAIPDGPVLYGNSGGGLGTVHGTATNLALFWSYSGNVGIGTTSPDALLSVNGTADKPGGGSWSTFSDERLKNVGPDFTRGLDDLARLQPVHYHYKANNPLNLPSQSDYVGVVAQQVQDAIPEAVQANQDGYLTVNNDPVIWTAINAIKELNRKTEARNQNSEARNQNVEDRMRKLEADNANLRKELTALQSVLKQLASRTTPEK